MNDAIWLAYWCGVISLGIAIGTIVEHPAGFFIIFALGCFVAALVML